MDDAEQAWQNWLGRLVDGDEAVVYEFWAQYGERLQRLAAQNLNLQLHRRFGPEDVVQSACRTFLRRVQEGQFKLARSEDLWRLMCAITLTKLREQARYHTNYKRGVQREEYLAAGGDSSRPQREIADPDWTPADAAQLSEGLQKLLASLDAEEQQLVCLKLEDRTTREISEAMGCSDRTVRRILSRIKSKFRRILDGSGGSGFA